MSLVYLAGGITGLDFEEANFWREEVKDQIEVLSEGKWKCFNPLAHFNSESADQPLIYGDQLEPYAMDVDLYKLRHSEVVILDLDHPQSIGTNIEIGISIERRIPIIGFCSYKNQKHIHAWHKEVCSVIVEDYESAVYEFVTHFINND